MHVPNLQDKMSEPPFPSELNPLTNPVLEHNLGRWAQVYFSTPPAKRQQAVSNLLEEIKRETGAAARGENRSPLFCPRPKIPAVPFVLLCQHQNPPGHKFCSRCGQVLQAVPNRCGRDLGAPEVGEAAPPQSENRCAVAARPGL